MIGGHGPSGFLAEEESAKTAFDTTSLLGLKRSPVLSAKIIGGEIGEIGYSMATSNATGYSNLEYNLGTDVEAGEEALVTVDFSFSVWGGTENPAGRADRIKLLRKVNESFLRAEFDGKGWVVSWKIQVGVRDDGFPKYDWHPGMRIEGRELDIQKKAQIAIWEHDDFTIEVETNYNVNVGAGSIFDYPQTDRTRFELFNHGSFSGKFKD